MFMNKSMTITYCLSHNNFHGGMFYLVHQFFLKVQNEAGGKIGCVLAGKSWGLDFGRKSGPEYLKIVLWKGVLLLVFV